MQANEVLSQRFISVLKSINFGILVESEERTIVLVNEAFLTMFSLPISAEEFMKIDCETAANAAKGYFKDEEGFLSSIHRILAERKIVLNQMLEMKDGRFLERDYYPVFMEDTYKGHAWIYKDVTEKLTLQEKLIQLATTDKLTGLANRHKFLEDLTHYVELAFRYKRPLSLILADADNFKSINDRYGHHTGDRALQLISDSLTASKRTVDILGRWGGEEFILLLPETELDQAKVVADRICVSVCTCNMEGVDQRITLSLLASPSYASGIPNRA